MNTHCGGGLDNKYQFRKITSALKYTQRVRERKEDEKDTHGHLSPVLDLSQHSGVNLPSEENASFLVELDLVN